MREYAMKEVPDDQTKMAQPDESGGIPEDYYRLSDDELEEMSRAAVAVTEDDVDLDWDAYAVPTPPTNQSPDLQGGIGSVEAVPDKVESAESVIDQLSDSRLKHEHTRGPKANDPAEAAARADTPEQIEASIEEKRNFGRGQTNKAEYQARSQQTVLTPESAPQLDMSQGPFQHFDGVIPLQDQLVLARLLNDYQDEQGELTIQLAPDHLREMLDQAFGKETTQSERGDLGNVMHSVLEKGETVSLQQLIGHIQKHYFAVAQSKGLNAEKLEALQATHAALAKPNEPRNAGDRTMGSAVEKTLSEGAQNNNGKTGSSANNKGKAEIVSPDGRAPDPSPTAELANKAVQTGGAAAELTGAVIGGTGRLAGAAIGGTGRLLGAVGAKAGQVSKKVVGLPREAREKNLVRDSNTLAMAMSGLSETLIRANAANRNERPALIAKAQEEIDTIAKLATDHKAKLLDRSGDLSEGGLKQLKISDEIIETEKKKQRDLIFGDDGSEDLKKAAKKTKLDSALDGIHSTLGSLRKLLMDLVQSIGNKLGLGAGGPENKAAEPSSSSPSGP